jgi:D-mannonate dehydratase
MIKISVLTRQDFIHYIQIRKPQTGRDEDAKQELRNLAEVKRDISIIIWKFKAQIGYNRTENEESVRTRNEKLRKWKNKYLGI